MRPNPRKCMVIVTIRTSFSSDISVYHAIHHKPQDKPQLIVKGTPRGNYDFLTHAWEAANAKARELGWIE